METLIQITTTSNDRLELEKISAHLVKENLAACCQIGGPISSTYCWEEEIVTSQEWTCSIKSIKRHYLKIEEAILELHHYQTPQIYAVEIQIASEAFERWVKKMTCK